jgi:uncharacterized membrane protein HdeD (DUF308 family)
MLAVIVMLAAFHDDLDPLGGGWHWQAAVVAIIEGLLSVATPLVLLDLARRRPDRTGTARAAPAAYAAYLLQAPVIVALALLLRPVAAPSWIKLVIAAAAGVLGCFRLAAGLRHVPALRRTL